MRQITEESVNAFLNDRPYQKSNVHVQIELLKDDKGHTYKKVKYYLFGNLIAWYSIGGKYLFVSHCGWLTTTTKERLNAILYQWLNIRLWQEKQVWYYQKEGEEKQEWTKGELIKKFKH